MTPKSSKALLIDRPSVKVLSLNEFSKSILTSYRGKLFISLLYSNSEDSIFFLTGLKLMLSICSLDRVIVLSK